jgi:hypothetical protein
MEPTARLEVRVIDNKDRAVAGATVGAWPNLRWREWGAVIFGADLYDTGEWMRGLAKPREEMPNFHDFDAKTNERGIAIIPNLPLDVTELAVHHEHFQIPVTDDGSRDERSAKVTLRAGVTNFLNILVEPITEASKMRHR